MSYVHYLDAQPERADAQRERIEHLEGREQFYKREVRKLATTYNVQIAQLQRDRRTANIGEQLDIDGQIRGLRWARKEADKIR